MNKTTVSIFLCIAIPFLIGLLTGNLYFLLLIPIVFTLVLFVSSDTNDKAIPIRPVRPLHGQWCNPIRDIESMDMLPSPGFKGAMIITEERMKEIEDIKESIKNCFIELSDIGLIEKTELIGNESYYIDIRYYKHGEFTTFDEFKNATIYPEQTVNEMILDALSKFQIEYPSITIHASTQQSIPRKRIKIVL